MVGFTYGLHLIEPDLLYTLRVRIRRGPGISGGGRSKEAGTTAWEFEIMGSGKTGRFWRRTTRRAIPLLVVFAALVLGFNYPMGHDIDRQVRELLALSPQETGRAVEMLQQISDPVERGFAVEKWVRQNRGKVELSKGQAICNQLSSKDDVRSCVRHLSAAHLRR